MANTTVKKFGGREKGTPNKQTKEIRAVLKQIVSKELENISTHIQELEPSERAKLLLKLLPYVMPKVNSVDHHFDEPFTWDF